MATRAKDTSPGIVKEKRRIVSSPSFPRPTNTTRKSVNTTTTTTIAPDYIKPTKPSNVDPSVKPVSIKASSSTLPKPDLARRRSFGSRPRSQPKKTAPAANAERSPTSTGPVVRPKPHTERSRSSTSLKAPASPSPRSKVDTTARKPVPVKSSRLATRPGATTIAVYKKKQPQSDAAAKTLKSTSSSAKRDLPKPSDSIDDIDARKSDHEVETDSCQDIHDQESICSSVVDANNENDNNEMPLDLLHDDLVEQINEDAYLLSEAIIVVSEIEQSEAELENKVDEVTEKLQQDNTDNDESINDADNANNRTISEADNANLDNASNRTISDADNSHDANSKKDGLESEEEKVTNNETSENNSVAAAEEEEKPVDDNNEKPADEEKEVEKVSGGDELKSENDDTKKKINNNSAGGSNKKEPYVASNDVIEEAASKLRVKRKNKVLALVGAFETVMSSQD